LVLLEKAIGLPTTEPTTAEEDEDVSTCKEYPEEVKVTEVSTPRGTVKKITTKRKITKPKGGKQETTVIVTTEEGDKPPETTITVTEEDTPANEEDQDLITITELPELVEVIEVKDVSGKPKKKTIRKRILKKRIGDKEQTTELITTVEDDKVAETAVIVKVDQVPKAKLRKTKKNAKRENRFKTNENRTC